jgi:hypothetical protein
MAVYARLILTVLAVLALLPAAGPARAQEPAFHPNAALGEMLAKKLYITQPTNPGGKNILDNSCIYKDSFSLSPSEELLDRCDLPAATGQFTAKYGRPDATSPAPGGKTLLEYFLLFNENEYHVKIFLGCAAGKTEAFAMVECKRERNRAKPGPPKDNRPLWKRILQ